MVARNVATHLTEILKANIHELFGRQELVKVLDKVKADMESFSSICKESRDFSLMLKSPIIPHLKKAEILKKTFSGKCRHKKAMDR